MALTFGAVMQWLELNSRRAVGPMKRSYSVDFAVAAYALAIGVPSLLGTQPAAAQDEIRRFEITPYAAYRMGGSFDDGDNGQDFDLLDSGAFGLIVNGRVEENTQWEFLFGRQGTEVDTNGLPPGQPRLDIDIDYLHLGGTYLFDGTSVRPFIALTLGISQFDPGLSGLRSERFFSASFGGGWQFRATEQVGVRLEGRAFTTFLDSDSDLFCESDGGGGSCLITIDANTLTQWEVRAGFVFRF